MPNINRSLFSPGAWFMLCLSAAAAADADPGEARLWLERMSDAMQYKNYSGTFVYLHESQLETMQIEHRNGASGISERLISLNGEPREVVKNNSNVICVYPGAKSVRVDKTGSGGGVPARLPTNLDELSQHYEISIADEERIAGRQCTVINIKPKDNFRYGYRLWIDSENHLMLKSVVLNEEGAPIEQVMFTALQLDLQASDQALQPTLLGENFVQHTVETHSPPEDMPAPRWQAERLPPGFTIAKHKQRAKAEQLIDQVVYSDGMASVSVFIEKRDGNKKHLQGTSHMGAVNAYGIVVDKHNVTVVGEVPSSTVELIGQSIRFNLQD